MATESHNCFANKSALIFGGGNGIGRAIALEFARRGARVAVADIDVEGAQETVASITAAGGEAAVFLCDVTSDESVQSTIEQAEMAFGEIDIVVNNVGVIVSGNPEDVPPAEWQRIIDLNLMPVVRSNHIFLPKLLQRGRGHIVNTASFSGLYPYASNRIPYAASKAAVVALSESLALYLEPKGIRVSCFCPGPVMTNVMKSMKSWSEDAVMSGPGSQFGLMSAEQSAVVLADGMETGKIFIPTHEQVVEVMQQHAADPDAFIHQKILDIASGDLGLPKRPV
ncbi:SDR family oxidoreductase [Pseudomaricurvus sp. HS19]|uniref:SDR family NAD(P)-dependent oxidoreductase n=1 Tax=Pseudomaricurvus sp. HS19 TaxID=2692626 RepID=UPI0013688D95|nr:SDR family oxidoreductase [Pseudomaricurvus sp. HS19]MYM61887.1 SDR family NAD(P)-dependent oxidoreductase [Pseudomaricurvus sp. HS19]